MLLTSRYVRPRLSLLVKFCQCLIRDSSRITGDSAGGGLALACLTVLRDLGLPMPAGAVLISPWVIYSLTIRGFSH